ncbi:hypothetical protein MNBD_NITROSPINAE04-1052 [hydrothermal vent metagenome]|uniref:Response regulatory domain-containing protein n=1 Tax=hydrothermal vent metagenome TaxID=652676 RepID=A0A3B1CNR3_9ZZZZ
MSKARALIADDSATIQKVFELAFENEDIEVVVAGDGKAAFEKACELKPDIVIADVNMPEMNGFDLCRKIKDSDDISSIPVFLLSSALDEFDHKRSVEVGAAGRFEKPFRSEEMVNMVKKALSQPPVEKDEMKDEDTFDDFDVPLDYIMEGLDLEIEDTEILDSTEVGGAPDTETLDLKAEEILESDIDDDDEFEVEVISGEEALVVSAEDLISEEDFEDSQSPVYTAEANIETESMAEDPGLNNINESVYTAIAGVSPINDNKAEPEENFLQEAEPQEEKLVEETRRELAELEEMEPEDDMDDVFADYIADPVDTVEVESLEKVDAKLETLVDLVLKEVESGPFNDVLQETVNNAILGKITDEKMEPLIKNAIESAISDMKPQIMEMLRNVATELTLNMAEDMVRQTIEQIKSDN